MVITKPYRVNYTVKSLEKQKNNRIYMITFIYRLITMREIIALIAIVLLWVFAWTQASGYVQHTSHDSLLSPVISKIDQLDHNTTSRNKKISLLVIRMEESENLYVQWAIKSVLLHLIRLEEEKNTLWYLTLLE